MVADRADIADTSAKRRTGLLKHTGLEPGEGLWIAPCEAGTPLKLGPWLGTNWSLKDTSSSLWQKFRGLAKMVTGNEVSAGRGLPRSPSNFGRGNSKPVTTFAEQAISNTGC